MPHLRPRLRSLVPAAVLLGMLAGCQDPDVGGSCPVDLPGVGPGPVGADYLVTGKAECENLVCILSPPPPAGSRVKSNPYCSKACVSDDECSPGETGLVCRTVVLDPQFLAGLSDELRKKYLGDVQFSSYCASPLP